MNDRPGSAVPARSAGRAWLSPRNWVPHAVLLGMALAWGTSVALATFAMADNPHPLGMALVSSVIGLACLTLVLAVRRALPPIGWRHLEFYVVCGLLGTAAPGILSLAAAAHLPAGVRSILFALIPLITLALTTALGRERVDLRRMLGLLLGLGSVLVLLRPGETAVQAGHLPWIAVSILTVACYALESVYMDLRRPAGLDPVAALWGMTVMAILMVGPVVWWTGTAPSLALHWGRTEMAVVTMSALNVAAYTGFIFLIGRTGPLFASQVSYLTPPAGILAGVVLLGESVTAGIGWSVGLVLLGIFLVRPRPEPTPPVARNVGTG